MNHFISNKFIPPLIASIIFYNIGLRWTVLAQDLPFLFGDSVGDFSTSNNDDGASIRFGLSKPVKFLGEEYDHFYQNTNGVITFTTTEEEFQALDSFPNSIVPPMVAVYWTDIDTRMGGIEKNQLWARNFTTETVGANDLLIARSLVKNHQESSEVVFEPTATIVVTYNRVNRWDRDESVENTFQMALAYNSEETWIILAYSKLEFYDASSSANRTLIGYNGMDLTGKLIRYLEAEDDMTNLVESSNCGTPGVYVFQTDKKKIEMNESPLNFIAGLSENRPQVMTSIIGIMLNTFAFFYNLIDGIIGERG